MIHFRMFRCCYKTDIYCVTFIVYDNINYCFIDMGADTVCHSICKNNVQKHLLRDETESEYSYNAPIIQIMKAKYPHMGFSYLYL